MDVYKDPKQLEEVLNKEILENIKEDTPWLNQINFNKDAWKGNPERFEDFQERIIKVINDIDKAIYEKKRNEKDGIIVGSNGQLVGLTGNATVRDWFVWYANEFKK